MLTTLADTSSTNNLAIWLAVIGIAGQLVIGLILLRFGAALRRVDKLETELKGYANELIETKHAQVLNAIERIEHRLADGDHRFSELNKHDHKAELQLVTKVESLHRYVTEHCATAEQQREFRKELNGITLAVARLQEAA